MNLSWILISYIFKYISMQVSDILLFNIYFTNKLMLVLIWMITYLYDWRRGSKHLLRDLMRTSHLELHPVPEGILVKVPALHFHKKSGTCWNSVFFSVFVFCLLKGLWSGAGCHQARGSAELPASCKYSGISQTCLEYLHGAPKNEMPQSPTGHLNSDRHLKGRCLFFFFLSNS